MARATVATSEQSCPDCGGPVVTASEAYCDDCGVVVEETIIDRGPEWRNFDDTEGNPARTGSGNTVRLHDHGRGSEIGYGDSGSTEIGNLRTWHKRCRRQGTERTLAHGLGETQRLARAVDCTHATTEDACVWMRRAHDRLDLNGVSLESVAAASVLLAARQADEPVTGDDVVEVSRIRGSEQDDYSRRSKEKKLWNMIREIGAEFGVLTTPPEPEVFVPRVCNDLCAPVRKRAVARCRRWQDHDVGNGRSPLLVAAAAVWTLADVTQKEVAEYVGCVPTTIRNIRNDAPDPDDLTTYF
jgi:transcription initiation factor TFIIB